jgi:SAM-dependent methyltransferase
MESGAEKKRGIGVSFLNALWRHGPLGTAKRVNIALSRYRCGLPGCQRLFNSIDACLQRIHDHLDGRFDRMFGTDTSGHISLTQMTIERGSIQEGIWYEPMSPKIFAQIMDDLDINYGEFDFIDFGSGKGRVLLLASSYGFRNVVGVEFAEELHETAKRNIELWLQDSRRSARIESVHMDGAEYPIPDVPLVVFFFSPFTDNTMARVLGNIRTSFQVGDRNIKIIFYGENPETIRLLKEMNFQSKELNLHADWSQFNKYRAFIFTGLQDGRTNLNDFLAPILTSVALMG